jgi:flagellar biosynthesis/type III secretory pathway protein FliH
MNGKTWEENLIDLIKKLMKEEYTRGYADGHNKGYDEGWNNGYKTPRNIINDGLLTDNR